VIGPVNDPPRAVKSFVAKLIVVSHPTIIRPGYTPILQCHTSFIPCKWKVLLQKINRNTNKLQEEYPDSLKEGDAALVEMHPSKEIFVESFEECPALSRFCISDMKRIIAVGVIESVEYAYSVSGRLTKAAH